VIAYSARNSAGAFAELAYRRLVEQARQPVFFTDYGVPDTIDGRFELICLHAFLYLHRLKAERPRANQLSQSFFDRIFADFDRALREMGVGDLSVGRHVKRMARAFYGRIIAYEEGLVGGDEILGAAVLRNVFGTVHGPVPGAGALTAYVRSAVQELRSQSAAELLAGRISFEAPSRLPVTAGPRSSEESR
jgi:cytochrome b pre-mRNA-processing protein 3